MKVILIQDVENVGQEGDITNVADGYARNFLIPRNLALVANKKNMKRLEHEQSIIRVRAEKQAKGAVELKEKIEAGSFNVSVNAGEDDKLFGSVTTADIADALKAQGIDIDKRKINVPEPIKKLGVYTVEIKLLSDLIANAKIWVIKN